MLITTKNDLPRPFLNTSEAGRNNNCLRRLFLLTETVKKSTSQNGLTEVVTLKNPPQSVLINRGGCSKANASVNPFTGAVALKPTF